MIGFELEETMDRGVGHHEIVEIGIRSVDDLDEIEDRGEFLGLVEGVEVPNDVKKSLQYLLSLEII